jgi:copper(I)-binding protein
MKRIIAVAAAVLLSGCHGSETASEKITSDGAVTHIVKSADVNGVKTTTDLAFTHFALRTPPNGQTTAAAYVTVTNKGSSADRLVSVSCACAQSAMFHTTTHDNGMVGMADMPGGFALPAGQSLVFKPGGNHIMLMGVTNAPKEGDFVDIVLTFAKAGPLTLHMPVRDAPLADDSSDAMSGMKM